MTLSVQATESRRAHPALVLLILWCVAVLAFLLVGAGAIWLRSWGPMGVRVFSLPSGSMMPTLQIGDYVLGAVHTVQRPKPRRGDIVLHHVRKRGVIFIKRVIGLPGDSIQLLAGRLHINGTLIPRERVEDFPTEDMYGRRIPVIRYRETFPDGTSHFIIERDRDRGYWDNTEVMRVPEGEVFVMGDNRDNSTDSRDGKEVGTVPIADIVAYPVLIVWSKDRSRIGSAPR